MVEAAMTEAKIASVWIGEAHLFEAAAAILAAEGSPVRLPLWLGRKEAEAVKAALAGEPAAEGSAHELLAKALGFLGGRIKRAEVTAYHDGEFMARLVLDQEGEERTVEARPADALLMALRFGASILVTRDVLAAQGVHPDEKAGQVAADDRDNLRRLAYGFVALDRLDDAIEAGERLAELDPAGFPVTEVLAASYAAKGRYREAAETYRRAINQALDTGNLRWAALYAKSFGEMDLSALKTKGEPARVRAPRLLEDFSTRSLSNGWWAGGGGATAGSSGGVVDAPGGRAGKAYRFAFDYGRDPWPWFYVEFLPNQVWEDVRAVSFDLFLPPDLAPASPVRMTFSVPHWMKGDASYDRAAETLKPGWTHYVMGLAEPKWTFKASRKAEPRHNVAFTLPGPGPVRGLTFYFPDEGRRERVTLYVANIRLE